MKAGGRRSREGSRCAVTEGELGVSAGRVAQAVDAMEAQGMERVRVCLGSLGPLPWRDLGQRCRDYSEVEHNPRGDSRATWGLLWEGGLAAVENR